MDSKVEIWGIVRIRRKIEDLRNALDKDRGAVKVVKKSFYSFGRKAGKFGLKPRHREDISGFIKDVL